VVNARHHARLMKLIGSGEVVAGGQADVSDRYIAPTVLKNVAADSPVMGEEIFGPILPVLKVRSIDEAIAFVNGRDKPLALYVFSKDAAVQDKVLGGTSSGGATMNHCWVHLAVAGLPFGGVGESGMGAYHGKNTFDTFSHKKAVLRKPFLMDPPVMYPPYTEQKRKLIKKFL
jgi:aldehyde dehydrogenase (NAD+)